jgi:hypothetical protein
MKRIAEKGLKTIEPFCPEIPKKVLHGELEPNNNGFQRVMFSHLAS